MKQVTFFITTAFVLVCYISTELNCHAQESVCVRVKIEIDQELTLERQGFEARMNIKNGGMVSPGNTVLYMNRTALEVLDLLGTNAGASDNFVRLVPKEIEGKEVMTWRDIPIRETDGLVNNEALVA